MLLLTIIKVALRSLMANKMRSFLAVLGIIIGVGAVIAMLAMGAGARQRVTSTISSMGTDLLTVHPGLAGRSGVRSAPSETLTVEDAEAILKQIPSVMRVAPVTGRSAQLKYYSSNTNTSVNGVSMTYFLIRNYEIERGRMFTAGEVERMMRVAVIAPTTAEQLFGTEDPVNKTIKVRGIGFTVVGLTKAKGAQGFSDPDDQLIVPYTTAMKTLFGQDYLREIAIQCKPGTDLAAAQTAVEELLRKRHRIRPDGEDDFHTHNQAELLSAFSEVAHTFTVLLAGIASISLFVGGIGIMNIMLVTVTERTREIGIRKAIGAKNRHILRQFLFESMLMSGVGGILGVIAGIGAARIIGKATQFDTAVEAANVILALSFAFAVGVFFGYYPARRAAHLDPVEALRYE